MQRECEIAGVLKSRCRRLLEATVDDPYQVRRDSGDAVAEFRRIIVEDRRHGLRPGVARERAAPCEEFVKDRAKRKQVGAMIDRQSAHLFRRHVPDGPQHDARFGRRWCGSQHACGNGLIPRQLRQAKVENLDAIVAGDENVLGFQIAMGDPLFVGRGKPVRDRQRQLNRLANPERTGTQPIAQRLALEQLRHDEGRGRRAVPMS